MAQTVFAETTVTTETTETEVTTGKEDITSGAIILPPEGETKHRSTEETITDDGVVKKQETVEEETTHEGVTRKRETTKETMEY